MNVCARCGNQNAEQARFCSTCGAALNAAQGFSQGCPLCPAQFTDPALYATHLAEAHPVESVAATTVAPGFSPPQTTTGSDQAQDAPPSPDEAQFAEMTTSDRHGPGGGSSTYVVCPTCGHLNKPSAGRCSQVVPGHRLDGAPRVSLDHKLGLGQRQFYLTRDAAGREALLQKWGAKGDLAPLVASAPKRADPRGDLNPAFVCPHCHVKGSVHTKRVIVKKGISGGKATGALLTGGLSLFATGLSRKESNTQASCSNCRVAWML
jgi:hypothetical protein